MGNNADSYVLVLEDRSRVQSPTEAGHLSVVSSMDVVGRAKAVSILECDRIAYFGCNMQAVCNAEASLYAIIEGKGIAVGIAVVNHPHADKRNDIPPALRVPHSQGRHQVHKQVGMVIAVLLVRQSSAFPLEALKNETVSHRRRMPFA